MANGYLQTWMALGVGFQSFAYLPRGAIIAIAELVDCRRTEEFIHNGLIYAQNNPKYPFHITDQERALGDFSQGRYAWMLYNIQALKQPVPYKGKQGLFSIPLTAIKHALPD